MLHPESISTLRNLIKLHGATAILNALQMIAEDEGIIGRARKHHRTTTEIIHIDKCECGKTKKITWPTCIDCEIAHYEYLCTEEHKAL